MTDTHTELDLSTTAPAEPVLEHTAPAPTEAETQSIYAWSHDDDNDDETAVIHRRSWKLPITLLTLTAAAVTATGVVLAWPQAKPATPVAGPTPSTTNPAPLPAVDPESKFVGLYTQRGYKENVPGQTQSLIGIAHNVCSSRAAGEPSPEIVKEFRDANANNPNPDGTTGIPQSAAQLLVSTAIDAMCPQYAN